MWYCFSVLTGLLTLDQELLLRRLLEQERNLAHQLAGLEETLRHFEEVERRAYESWSRIEFGPQYADLEKLYEEIRMRQAQVRRIQDLVRDRGMSAREALYAVQSGAEPESRSEAFDANDEDVIEARRRAKREAKRADRKQTRREQRKERIVSGPTDEAAKKRRSIVSLYRIIARKLHPDSATASKFLTKNRAKNLWHEVQTAYQAGNYERLVAIGAWLQGEDETEGALGSSATATLSHDDRLRRLRSLEKSCRTLESRITELRGHPAWEFTTTGSSLRKKLRKQLAREIEAEFANAQEVVEALDEFFSRIGPPRAPRRRR